MSQNSLYCCSPCRPTFKRHVNAIYPADPNEGLVKTKMETLVYYSMTSPEKLDRIGEYLEQRISRDIYRNRKGMALIGMEAMDQLLKSCHVNTINLFVESYLKTVQKLLESPDPELQIVASASFLGFSLIEEDTPSYHRSYNFFIERFSSMCHSELDHDPILREKIRLSGLRGLKGVIKKTVNEDLAENIWDPKHMDKIVPSLLYNMDPDDSELQASSRDTPDLDDNDSQCASKVADQILRELVSSASFASIKAILRPVLCFMADHQHWDNPSLGHAIHTFEAIMYSIQGDLSYIVIDRLMAHIDSQNKPILQKASIAIVLSRIIGIGVGDSTVGPAVLEIINELLKNLKKSVEKDKTYDQSSDSPIQQLQSALLESLGEYTNKMPDFQKIEVMTFILGKVPFDVNADHELQLILMKALYHVAEKQTPTAFSTTFSNQLLATLLRLLQAPDQDVRLLVLQTFEILIDRHNNREKLAKPILHPGTLDLDSCPNKFSRSDHMFVQKSMINIFGHFKKVLEEQSNTVEFIEAIYTTCSLLHVETSATDESAFYLLDLIDAVQSIATSNLNLSTENRFALHAIAICFLNLLASTINSTELDTYVDTIVHARQKKTPHMLPPINEEYRPGLDPNIQEDDILISKNLIMEALKNAGKDVERIDALPQRKTSPSRNSWPEPQLPLSADSSRRASTISSSSLAVDHYGSLSSSPVKARKPLSEEITVAAFKKILEGPSQLEKEAEDKRKRDLQDKFLNASLEEICEITGKKGPEIHEVLNDLFARIHFGEEMQPVGGKDFSSKEEEARSIMDCPDPYTELFPELFMY